MSATMTKHLGILAAGALAVGACASSGGAARERGASDDPTSTTTSTGTPTATSSSRAATSAPSAARPERSRAAAESKDERASSPRRELSPRAQRLFDEAVAARAEFDRLKTPVDWETLERRWRAVTDAEAVPEAYFNLGVALERRGKLDEARAAYRRAVELEPRLSPAAANLLLLDEPADPGAAAQRWAELVRQFPQEPVARARLAALYEAAGQHDEAWKLAREALLRDPRAVSAYKVMMRVALARKNHDLAMLLAVKAQKLDASDPEIVAFVGDLLWHQKDEPAALAQWKKALALKDDFLPARYALLERAVAKQHWDGAAEQARAILKSAPDPRVQLTLGVAYRYLGKPDQALAAYDQAEKLAAGKLPEVHLARAVTLMKSKEQCEPALVELRRYVTAAGPAVAAEGPAMKLTRECEQIVQAGREAEEAAKEMKAQAEREAAQKAAAAQKDARPAGASGADAKPSAQPVAPAPAPGSAAPQAGEQAPPTSAANGRRAPTR